MTETNATNENNGIVAVLSAADRDYLALQWREAVSKRTVYHGGGCSGHRSFVPVGEQTFEIRHIDNPARVHVAVEGMIRCRVCGHDQQYMICAKYPVERPFVTDNTEVLAPLAHVRKLDVRAGDVLMLDETYDDMDEDQMACVRVKAEATIRAACGFDDVRVLVVPPGAKIEKRKPHHRGFLCVSRELLMDWLGLPVGTTLDAISEHARFQTNEIVLRVEHPALPTSTEGQVMPQIEPSVEGGTVSHRINWNANGAMPGVPPTMRPDAAKLVALLQRVSEEFVRCNADAGVYSKVVGAILELSGKGPQVPVKPLDILDSPTTFVMDGVAPKITMESILAGKKVLNAIQQGVAERIKRESDGAYVPGEQPQLVTAPDEMRCCVIVPDCEFIEDVGDIDYAGERCISPSRFWVGKNGIDDYTYCCIDHLVSVWRLGDTIRDAQTNDICAADTIGIDGVRKLQEMYRRRDTIGDLSIALHIDVPAPATADLPSGTDIANTAMGGYFFAPGTPPEITNEFRERLQEHVENADASVKAQCKRDVSVPLRSRFIGGLADGREVGEYHHDPTPPATIILPCCGAEDLTYRRGDDGNYYHVKTDVDRAIDAQPYRGLLPQRVRYRPRLDGTSWEKFIAYAQRVEQKAGKVHICVLLDARTPVAFIVEHDMDAAQIEKIEKAGTITVLTMRDGGRTLVAREGTATIQGLTGTADGRAFTNGTLTIDRPFADLFRAYREGKLADPDLCALIAQLERQGLLDKDGMPIPAVPKGGPSRKIEMLYVTTVENADPDCRIKPAEPEEPPGEDKVEPSGSERKVNFREFL